VLAAATPEALDDFYKTVAELSFILLGLWWVVVQFRYEDWVRDVGRRREAYLGSLYFLLPGVMSLMSAVAGDGALWRFAFASAGAVGLVAAIIPSGHAVTGTAVRAIAGVLHTAVIVFAVFPELAGDLGAGIRPREVEAVVISLIIVLGCHAAWRFFTVQPPRSQG
jgi:hypothetical protein